jgi:hypothetical protein
MSMMLRSPLDVPSFSLTLRRRRRRTLFFMAFIAASCGALGTAEPAVPPRHTSRITADCSAAVNWDFARLPKLDAWRNTSLVIRKTMAQWYPPGISGRTIENAGRESLRGFFSVLSKSEASDWSIVYLASHQSRGGQWQFSNDPSASWAEILGGIQCPPKGGRFVILDACFAEAADSDALISGTRAKGILFASARPEEAHEMDFERRFPIDAARRFPAESRWLRGVLGREWDGRISFLGFVWLRAFLATPGAPHSMEDWNAFFRLCENLAHEFRGGRGAALATTIHFVGSPAPVSH